MGISVELSNEAVVLEPTYEKCKSVCEQLLASGKITSYTEPRPIMSGISRKTGERLYRYESNVKEAK